MSGDPTCLAVVPLRSFGDTKTRLAGALSPGERSALAQELAAGVVDALGGASVATVIVTDDAVVGAWARDRGVAVIGSTRPGLDGAAEAGRAHARALDATTLAVVHADLAAPARLPAVVLGPLAAGTVRLVPDRHRDGTNVLVLPTGVEFAFGYGPGSFDRHCAEARARDLAVEVADVEELGWDVDELDDLAHYRALPREP